MELHRKLRKARERRKLTFYAAAQHMDGVSQQQLMNLEHYESATRNADPAKVTVQVMAEVVRVFWPDIQLADFLETSPELSIKITAINSRALRKLEQCSPTG